MNVVVLENLRKSYGDLRAVDGVSFEVRRGEIFGMVGPNGAGKTTTIECLEGLPQSVRSVSRFIPLTHVVTLMRGLWAGESWGKHLTEAAVLGGVLLVGMLLSARFFRWE